jgi:predicted AAA+ superfamily ATPase
MEFLQRNIEKECLALAGSYPVISLLGPRQSGKTTLVKHLFKDKPYVSVEHKCNSRFTGLNLK